MCQLGISIRNVVRSIRAAVELDELADDCSELHQRLVDIVGFLQSIVSGASLLLSFGASQVHEIELGTFQDLHASDASLGLHGDLEDRM